MRNAAISGVRQQLRRRDRLERAAAGRRAWFEPDPDDLLDAVTAQVALAKLSEGQREIVVLRIWAEMTFEEAAEVTGYSVSTLFSRYRAALAAMRRELRTPCETPTD